MSTSNKTADYSFTMWSVTSLLGVETRLEQNTLFPKYSHLYYYNLIKMYIIFTFISKTGEKKRHIIPTEPFNPLPLNLSSFLVSLF